MLFFCRTIIALLFLSLNPVCSSDVDLDLKATLAISQLSLAEQNSALAQHSKALSQILQTLEHSHLDSQGEAQSLVQMTQGFQEQVAQLTQELSRQQSSAFIQLNKELASQHSSSLMTLSQYQCTEHSSSVSQMAEDMRQLLTASLTNQSEAVIDTVTKMGESLQEAVTQMAEKSESISTSLRQLSESLIAMGDGIQEALTQESLRQREQLSSALRNVTEQLNETFTAVINLQESTAERNQEFSTTTQPVPEGFEKVSDGWFHIIQEKKSWRDAREHCQRVFGADLASPPTAFDAFKTFVHKAVGGTFVWIGGIKDGSVWRYLNGIPVQSSHWTSGQPNNSDEAYLAIHTGYSPPVWDRTSTEIFYFACRFG